MKGAVIKRMVLDASVAVAWCFEDESSDFTEGVLDLLASGTEALAPAVWPLELVNALLMAERRKRITVAQVTALLRRIAGLPISIDQHGSATPSTRYLQWHASRTCPRTMPRGIAPGHPRQ